MNKLEGLLKSASREVQDPHDAPDPSEAVKQFFSSRKQEQSAAVDPVATPESNPADALPEGFTPLQVLSQEEASAESDANLESVEPTSQIEDAPSAEYLDELRIAWHDLSARLFSGNKEECLAALEQAIGRVIDLGRGQRYTVESFLSHGTFGAVFKVTDAAGEPYAVKIFPPSDRQAMFDQPNPSTTPDKQLQATALARSSINETAALNTLTKLGDRNPGPALITAQMMPDPRMMHKIDGRWIADRRMAVLVMEYLDGTSLSKFSAIHRAEPMVLVDVIRQAAEELAIIHDHGIVHGDVKATNIMVSPTAQARWIDLGNAIVEKFSNQQDGRKSKREEPHTPQLAVYAQSAIVALNEHYALPGEAASRDRDRYSFGRVIQLAIFGPEAFQNPTLMREQESHLTGPYKELAAIADQLTREQPTERIQLDRVGQLLNDLIDREQDIANIQQGIAAA